MSDIDPRSVDWHKLSNDLFKIANDPNETPQRRRKAQRAWKLSLAGSGPLASTPIVYSGHAMVGHTRGGYAQKSDMDYDGYNRS